MLEKPDEFDDFLEWLMLPAPTEELPAGLIGDEI